MQLVLHQFRHDLRLMRFHLAFWAGLLVLDLAASLGWLGSPVAASDQVGQILSTMLPPALVGCQVFFLITAIAVLMTVDAPINPNGFMATRPLPMRDWLQGKVVFIGACLILPAVGQEFIRLLLAGLPLNLSLHGTGERLWYMVLICAAAGGLAVMAQQLKQFIALLIAGLAAGYVVGIALALISAFATRLAWVDDTYMVTRGLVFLHVLALGMCGAAALAKRLRWRRNLRFGVVSAASGAATLAACMCAVDWFAPTPAAPRLVEQAAAQMTWRMPANALQFSAQTDTEQRHRLGITARVPGEIPISNTVVRWVGVSAELRSSRTGQPLAPRKINRRADEVFQAAMNFSMEELRTMLRLGPPEARLEFSHFAPVQSAEPCFLGTLELPQPATAITEPAQLQARMEGLVFQWEKVAELELSVGARAHDAEGQWRIAAVKYQPNAQQDVTLERRQINLALTRNQRLQTTRYWPGDRYDFAIYDPADKTMRTLHYRSTWGNVFYGHTAYSTHALRLNFPGRQQPTITGRFVNDNLPLDPPRLLVFRRTYLGKVTREWTSSAMVLAEVVPAASFYSGNRGQMTRAELLRQVRALAVPDPASATREEVARYLGECLRLVRSRGGYLEPNSLLVLGLEAYVPAHLPLFLESLERDGGYQSDWLLHVIQRGAEESQKGVIISGLRRNPNLVQIINRRGWQMEARAELLALLDSPRTLPFEYWRALAWYEDPATAPRILEQLEQNPETWTYDVARMMPGIEPQLDQTVERIMRRWPVEFAYGSNNTLTIHRLAISEGGFMLRAYPGLGLALKHGRREAFNLALTLLKVTHENRQEYPYDLISLLREGLVFQGAAREKYWDNRAVGQWLVALQPEDFRFDPIRRRFVVTR